MKQDIIKILSLIALSSIANAGVLKRTSCYKDGVEIPCLKTSDKVNQVYSNSENGNKQRFRGSNVKNERKGIKNFLFNSNFWKDHGQRSSNKKSEAKKDIFGGDFFSNLFGGLWNNNNNAPSNNWGFGGNDWGLGGNDWGFGGGNTAPGNDWGFGGGNAAPGNDWGFGGGNTVPGNDWGFGGNDWGFGGNTAPGAGANPPPANPGNGAGAGTPPEPAPGTPAPGTPDNNTSVSSSNNNSELPRKPLAMTGFRGCTAQQKQLLEGLIEDIKTYRAGAVYALGRQNDDPKYQQIFLKYFKDQSVLPKVQEVFNNINAISSAEAFCEQARDEVCMQNALAYTYLYAKEFHVCPEFFTFCKFGTIEQHSSEAAAVVLHELSHSCGTDDYAYEEYNIVNLPASQASNNADTYRIYAMRILYYLKDTKRAFHKEGAFEEFLDKNIDFGKKFKDVVIKDKKKYNNYNNNYNNTISE